MAARCLALLAVGLSLASGCHTDCEQAEERVTEDGWRVLEDVSRTPGDLEDSPGLLAIADSGEMQLAFVRGMPTTYDDEPMDYPHTPQQFRYHDGDWCGPLATTGGWITAAGDAFYRVTAGDAGDLLVSRAVGETWPDPVSVEVPGVAASAVVGLAARSDSLGVAILGATGDFFAARIAGQEVEEPTLLFADSEDCLFDQLLMDVDGHFHAIATCDRTGARIPTYASDASGTWQREALPYLSGGTGGSIAVGPDGVVHSVASACMVDTCPSFEDPVVIAYTRRIDGEWTTPVEAVGRFATDDLGVYQPESPQIAVLDDGLVVLAFIENRGAWWDDDTHVRFSRDGGPFDESVQLQQTHDGGNVYLHQLAANPATGLPVVLFRHYIPDRPSFSLGVAWPESADALP